jgi:hypothetical protein
MSIDFMIIGAPRSGTAWAANWFTDSHTVCHHDPLFQSSLEALDSLPCDGRLLGIADTGIWMFPEYLAAHKARKVILHRNILDVNQSLSRAGLPSLPVETEDRLWDINGAHCDWHTLFDNPGFIYRNLFGVAMPDPLRHSMLCKLNVQVDFEKIDPDPAVTARLLERLANGARA